MEGLRGAEAGGNPWRLSKLYSDAKQSYRSAIPTSTADDVPELQSANRKFRMQKDRLIAWGIEWTDSSNASQENPIDETVGKAGLTEVVSSVMENIIGMIDEVEKLRLRIKPAQPNTTYALDKAKWDASDIHHYNDLVRDITSAIDLLCDLSKTKRPPSRAGAPQATSRQILDDENRLLSDYEASKASEELAKALQSQEDPASITARKLDRKMLIMPEEASPPYDSFGMPCPVQIVGRMRTKEPQRDFKGNEHSESTIPVLVEYARYDPIYQGHAVPLPFTRLNQLSNILTHGPTKRPTSLLNFIGYFEDSTLPRVGLVYELPAWTRVVFKSQPASLMKPESLHSLIQAASQARPTPAAPIVNPPLEDRFMLASELVSGLSHLLDRGLTHKDVNSTSVTFFPSLPTQEPAAASASGLQYAVRRPVVCSLDLFSEYDIDRERENLHQNIYRHPEDPRIRGPNNNEEYHPRYDMYSLGLLLLEIGLWAPLAKMFKVKYSLKDFGLRLKKIWIPRLASECGSVYMRAVQELIDMSGEVYMTEDDRKNAFSRICARLQKCCLLDEGEFDSLPADYTPPEEPKMYTYTLSDKHPVPESADIDGDVYRSGATPAERPTAAPFEIEPSPISEHSAPPGAWPDVPIFPDFEMTNLGCGQIVKRAFKPLRYLFPRCPILKAVCKEAYRIERRLCKIGEKVLDPAESASISLDGFGESESVAKPTFCIMCSSTSKFYKAVKKNLAFDQDMFDLIVFQGAVSRSKAYSTVARRSAKGSEDLPAKNPDHHERPVCGASIGAWKDSEHLPPVSFGGVVMIDGEPYGMSVHHMLEAPDCDSDDEEGFKSGVPGLSEPAVTRSSGRQRSVDTLDDFVSADVGYDDDDDDDISLADSDVESITFSDIEDDEDDEAYETNDSSPGYPPMMFSEGDTVGIARGSGSEITITQPALDDVAADFFPVAEDMDEDHLSSHSLGWVHASSGIRRLTHNGVDHEIDWALMELSDDRLQPQNVVPGGRRHCSSTHVVSRRNASNRGGGPSLREPVCRKPYDAEEDHYPTTVLPSKDLAERDVHSLGRTSGLATGTISCFMEFVKMSGRRTWSESWTVRSTDASSQVNRPGPTPTQQSPTTVAKLGSPGDSGAWIIDNATGQVCGHVLAFSSAKQIAYIAPMDVLLHDIASTLSASSVSLPGGIALPIPTNAAARIQDVEWELASMSTGYPGQEAECDRRGKSHDDDMEEELARMRIGDDTSPRSRRVWAQHMLMSGAQSHLEKEWASRRAALGMECRAGG